MHFLPTRIFYGRDAVKNGSAQLAGLGTKALIVTGRNSALKSGALDDILTGLKNHHLEWFIFDEVAENPVLETVLAGAQVFLSRGCDFLIGIGGGSPIDAAKAIALTSANHLDIDNIYNTSLFKQTFPVAAVPTTSGTGTEVTQYSVLTDASRQKKAGFGHDLAYPVLALVDPKYTLTLSPSTTLNTGIDALSHLLEGIYSNKRSHLIYPLIFQGIRLIINHLPAVLQNPDDYKGRDALMTASLYGGIAISHTSTTLQHSIGYPLTSVFNVPHGLANGIVMKQIMQLYEPAVKPELDELFAFLQMNREDFFAWLDSFNLSLNIKITPDFIDAKIPEVLASRNMANNPYAVSADEIRNLYCSLNQ